jgi:hypothetical protein
MTEEDAVERDDVHAENNCSGDRFLPPHTGVMANLPNGYLA